MANRFDFGSGHVFIGNIEQEGVRGVVISHSKEKHEVDSKNPEWTSAENTPYMPKDDDVLLMATSREGARVLQNMVNALCLLMDGFAISD